MPFGFRRSVRLGPLRLTASKRGVSASTGLGPVRVSRSSRAGAVRPTSSGARHHQPVLAGNAAMSGLHDLRRASPGPHLVRKKSARRP